VVLKPMHTAALNTTGLTATRSTVHGPSIYIYHACMSFECILFFIREYKSNLMCLSADVRCSPILSFHVIIKSRSYRGIIASSSFMHKTTQWLGAHGLRGCQSCHCHAQLQCQHTCHTASQEVQSVIWIIMLFVVLERNAQSCDCFHGKSSEALS